MLVDSYGRPTHNLRVSVTGRCNLACLFCHREGETSKNVSEMTPKEIGKIVEIAAKFGVSKVKLTAAGEPLMREDITEIVQQIGKIRGITDLSMVTNGTLLSSQAKELHGNGLARVNVNIPTLDSKTYRELTGGNLKDVLDGIRAAVESGLYPVKLNMLILKGINEEEIPKMINYTRRNGTILQIIELEPVNVNPSYYLRYHQPLNDVEEELQKQALQIKTRRNMQNRRVYFLPDAKVEVIRPIENTEFCSHCSRIRLTSDGKLKPCLMRDDNLVDILTLLRNGAGEETLTQLFIEAIKRREPYYKAEARFWKINPLLKVLTPTLFVRNYGDSGQPCLHFTIVALTTTFQALSAILASGAPFAFMAATSILSLKFNPSISICLASLMSSPVFSTVSKFKLEKWYLRLKSDPRGLFLEKG